MVFVLTGGDRSAPEPWAECDSKGSIFSHLTQEEKFRHPEMRKPPYLNWGVGLEGEAE